MLSCAEEIEGSLPPTVEVATACGALRELAELSATLRFDAVDETELRRLLEHARAAETALAVVVAAIADRAAALAKDGRAAPPREFLLHTGRIGGRRAGNEAGRAVLFALLPGARSLFASGAIGLDHIDTMARQLVPLTDNQRERLGVEDLLNAAANLPADTFAKHLGRAVAVVETTPDPASPTDGVSTGGDLADNERDLAAEAKRAASRLRHWFDADTGMGHLSCRLDPERYEALTTAIDHHTSRLASEAGQPTAKNANLAAAALVDLVTRPDTRGSCAQNSKSSDSGSRRMSPPHITVVITADDVQTGNGHPLTDHAARRLLCDSVVQRVVLDEQGLPINVGRRYRTATATQWTAIRSLYSSCAWDHCDRPLDWCQLHHIQEWANGGRSDLDNLVPLCNQHHHRVHEGGWTIRLLDDRSLSIQRPDGSHYATTDPPRRTPTREVCRPALSGGS